MTDPELVLHKLGVLTEYLRRAEQRRARPLAELLASEELQDALAMSFLVAIQEALDVAFHLCADEGWGIPASNAESFDLLARHGVIDADLSAELGQVARLRNRIAHGYASLDAERLWTESPAGVATLRRFATLLAGWMAQQPRH